MVEGDSGKRGQNLPRFPGYPFARWAPGDDGRGKENGALRLADQLEQAGTGVEVLLVHLEVFGEAFDAGGQEGDLNFRRSGIAFVSGVFLDNYLFLSRINSHSSFSLKRV